jgi:hypothetical protein
MAYKNKEQEREFQRKHYQDNKELYKSRAQASRITLRKRNSEYVRQLKECTPCKDCKGFFHYSQMDFDHIRNDKTVNIARISNSSISLKRIKAEISKCELVCANCHRLRTWKRLQIPVV